ncbi:uncharacterized protein LOC129266761 [Lytechinus pictus]|uniref:uncharacterized protein LOC129266761 n=1 Tax=Lytechinus pictus TaxID=7653 RepID=UPI0030B9E1E1
MEEQSHHDASQSCAAMGATLVVPSSQAEFDEFRDRTEDESGEGGPAWIWVWMGCGDTETEGVYTCSDGTEIPANSNWWSAFQPNNFLGIEDCIVYFRTTRKLVDVPCQDFNAFALCEKSAQRLSHSPVLKESRLRRKYQPGSEFEDYCLVNHAMYTMNARSLGRCAVACSEKQDCFSLTYHGGDGGVCEMYDVTEAEVPASDFVERPGCIYYEKI